MTKLNLKDSFLSATLHLVECKRQITKLCIKMEDEERAVDMDTLDDVRIEIENSILPMLVDLQERVESVEVAEKPDYSHMFDIAFSVTSQKEDPYKVLPLELRAALITRIADIDLEKGWEEAVGFCDSYEVEKKND